MPPWDGDCIVHDWYYWSGGQSVRLFSEHSYTRREADAYLFECIRARGYPVWAWLCWIGVRAGGSQYLPFSWRWRYRDRYIDVLWEVFA